MKPWVFLLFFCFQAGADLNADLEACASDDAKCVGRVILNAIKPSVEFYHDDGACASGRLIARVVIGSKDTCRQIAATKNPEDIWGIRMDGVCKDVPDMRFLDGCLKYVE